MSDIPYLAAKQADAQAVIAAVEAVRTVVEGLRDQPHWFGGLPESLTQAASGLDHHANRIRADFQLSAPPAV